MKHKPFRCKNCGRCCGPIPVTDAEWRRIRRAVRHKPEAEIERMAGQKREPLTCPLRDVENKRCFVYDVRPALCRLQGTQVGLRCPLKPSAATGTDGPEILRLEQGEKPVVVGLMSIDLGWRELLDGLKRSKADEKITQALTELDALECIGMDGR